MAEQSVVGSFDELTFFFVRCERKFEFKDFAARRIMRDFVCEPDFDLFR